MKEVLSSDRTDLAIAEKPRESEWTKGLLDRAGVMMDGSKQPMSSSVAAAKTSTVNLPARQLILCPT